MRFSLDMLFRHVSNNRGKGSALKKGGVWDYEK